MTVKFIYSIGRLIIFVLVATLIVLFIYSWYFKEEKQSFEAKIGEIKTMVRLSSLDIRDEMVITDTINNKVLTAIVKIKGSIGFDVEQLFSIEKGDTLIIQLPPEIIESYESDESKGYEIIDLYSLNLLSDLVTGGYVPFNSQEENSIKKKIPGLFSQKMYEKGYVKRARANAVETLAKLFSLFHDKIIIVDNYPEGFYRSGKPKTKEVKKSIETPLPPLN